MLKISKHKANIFIFFLIFFGSKNAHSYCFEPSAPSSFSKPTKPSAPYCVNEYSRTHTCDDWEINSYNNDIEQYNYDVENYISKLNNYVQDAQEYARCEARSLN